MSHALGVLDAGVKMGCPGHGLETTCADELEGNNRHARGEFFYNYTSDYFARVVDNATTGGYAGNTLC